MQWPLSCAPSLLVAVILARVSPLVPLAIALGIIAIALAVANRGQRK